MIIPLLSLLGWGNEIILANWPIEKHIKCNKNNDIPIKIPSFSYFCSTGVNCAL